MARLYLGVFSVGSVCDAALQVGLPEGGLGQGVFLRGAHIDQIRVGGERPAEDGHALGDQAWQEIAPEVIRHPLGDAREDMRLYDEDARVRQIAKHFFWPGLLDEAWFSLRLSFGWTRWMF